MLSVNLNLKKLDEDSFKVFDKFENCKSCYMIKFTSPSYVTIGRICALQNVLTIQRYS